MDLKIVANKLLSLADLARAQALCTHELSIIMVVSDNTDLVFVTFFI